VLTPTLPAGEPTYTMLDVNTNLHMTGNYTPVEVAAVG